MTDTPTPPAMTPEQRAELVKSTKINAAMINFGEAIPWGSETILMEQCANQLEADGVELARLTGMLDDYYPAIDWWILQAKESHEAQLKAEAALTAERDAAQAEIARLTAALATAREDGMREAVQIAIGRKGLGALERTHPYERGYSAACDAIEAAITKGAAT